MRLNTATPQTMIELLRDRAAAQPDGVAYTFLGDGEHPGSSLTWEHLERRSRAIAAAITRRTDPGARVLVLFPPTIDFVPAFFGALFAGAIAIPAYPPGGTRLDRTYARLRGMILDAGVTLVLAPGEQIERANGAGHALPELAAVEHLDPGGVSDAEADEWRMPVSGPHSVALLQYTSGSTAAPRGVMVGHGNLLHNLACTHADARYTRDSVSLSWLPVNHDMGLINGVLQAAFSGCTAYLMAPAAFLQRPARWLQAISRLGVTHSGGPNFAYDLCVRRVSDRDAATLDLASWTVAYNGAEPVRRATLEAFQRRFGSQGFRWEAFSPAYGLAESTLLVSSVPASTPPVVHGDAVASGTLDQHSRLLVVDPATRTPLPEGQVGELWVAGESVALGYWNRAAETADTFRATTADGRGPFLRTGDLAFIRGGHLFVAGRLKDVIIVRGVKHHPQDIEHTVERAHPALRAGCCAAIALDEHGEEKAGLLAELDPRSGSGAAVDLDEVIASIRLAVSVAHHLVPSRIVLVPPNTVPKTTSGKLQRFLCREGVMTRAFEPLSEWRAAALDERVAS